MPFDPYDAPPEMVCVPERKPNPLEIARDGPMPPCAICGHATGKPHDNVVLLDRYLICLECNAAAFAVLRREVLQLRGLAVADMLKRGEGKSNG